MLAATALLLLPAAQISVPSESLVTCIGILGAFYVCLRAFEIGNAAESRFASANAADATKVGAWLVFAFAALFALFSVASLLL